MSTTNPSGDSPRDERTRAACRAELDQLQAALAKVMGRMGPEFLEKMDRILRDRVQYHEGADRFIALAALVGMNHTMISFLDATDPADGGEGVRP